MLIDLINSLGKKFSTISVAVCPAPCSVPSVCCCLDGPTPLLTDKLGSLVGNTRHFKQGW